MTVSLLLILLILCTPALLAFAIRRSSPESRESLQTPRRARCAIAARVLAAAHGAILALASSAQTSGDDAMTQNAIDFRIGRMRRDHSSIGLWEGLHIIGQQAPKFLNLHGSRPVCFVRPANPRLDSDQYQFNRWYKHVEVQDQFVVTSGSLWVLLPDHDVEWFD